MNGWEVAALLLGGGFVGTGVNTVLGRFLNNKKYKVEIKREEGEAKKVSVDATVALTEAAVNLITPLKTEILQLQSRVESLEDDLGQHKTIVEQAVDYIRQLHDWIDQYIPRDLSRPVPPYTLDGLLKK